MAPIDNRLQTLLAQQKQAVIRAMKRAREAGADHDAKILQSLVHLLDELHDKAPEIFLGRAGKDKP